MVSRSFRTREIGHAPTVSAEGEVCERVRTDGFKIRGVAPEQLRGSGARTTELEQPWNDNLPCLVAARGGGCMPYGIIAIFDQTPFSNDALLDALDAACARPPTRTPDRPSSTR